MDLVAKKDYSEIPPLGEQTALEKTGSQKTLGPKQFGALIKISQ